MKSLAVLLVTFCAANAAVLWKDECAPGYFHCGSGLCIPDLLLCDGVFDCVSGNDETKCVTVSDSAEDADEHVNECSEGSFTCNNGLCIPSDFECDGVYNCVSGNDEANCGDTGTSGKDECAPGYFHCGSGLCIPDLLVCDGVFDCVSGNDETNCATDDPDSQIDD